MHSHNRTLIQSLGFADGDRKNSRHDLACQYISQQSVLRNILELPDFEIDKVECERELEKDAGYGRSVIGYIDVFVRGKYNFRQVVAPCEKLPDGAYDNDIIRFIIEVKVKKVPVSEIIRQLKFYSGYYRKSGNRHNLCTVVDWPLTEADVAMLMNEKIWPVQLGPDFERWIRDGRQATIKTT